MPASRLLDVWIVETNAVYTEVPFAVVVDWIQQGRLLGNDRVRQAGRETWHAIAKVAALNPYLPVSEPLETAAAAEALAPVDLGFDEWRRPDDADDDDVDMIPLIDISLVLLIFFMMTATVSSGIFSPIQTPTTNYPQGVPAANQYWVGVEPKGDAKAASYSLGRDDEELSPPTSKFDDFRGELMRHLSPTAGEVKVRIRADRSLPIETITALIRELRELQARLNRDRGPGQAKVNLSILGEVSEVP